MRSKASVTIGNGTHGVLPRAPTGIPGLDEITLGGLPRHSATLICGGRLRQNAVRYGIASSRRDAIRRTRQLVRAIKRPASRLFLHQCLAGKKVQGVEVQLRRPDRTKCNFLMSAGAGPDHPDYQSLQIIDEETKRCQKVIQGSSARRNICNSPNRAY